MHLAVLDASRSRVIKSMIMIAWQVCPILIGRDIRVENEILKTGARDCAPLRHWGKGAVTLLGDSAHPCTPNLGQGGCMALEDAVILAKCLGSGLPIEAALPRYESLRFHRTKHIQQRSLVMGYTGQWQAPLFVNGRNIVPRMLPARLIERNLRRVYSYAA